MTKILKQRFPRATNMGERPQFADAYILGGGTLISPNSLYPGRINPEKTIGFSLGVSSNWNGEWLEILKRMKKIYVRDFFSYRKLKQFGVQCTQSVDLVCALEIPEPPKVRDGIWANLMYTECSVNPNLQSEIDFVKKELGGREVNYFAMSPVEDIGTVFQAAVYGDAKTLLSDLSTAETIYTTRLHAAILAWMSGCKDIRYIDYDPKIEHFRERVKGLTPKQAYNIVHRDLDDLCALVS